MSRNLVQRILFAIVAIPVTVAVIWWGGWPLAGLIALLGVLGTREIYDLARRQGLAPLGGIGYAAAAAIPLATYWAKGSELHWAEPTLFVAAIWVLAVMSLAMGVRSPQQRPLPAVAVTIFGPLYASALPSFLIAIRHGAAAGLRDTPAAALVMLPLALVWICDTAAMAAGSAIGGPKLAPVLSPKKTWAGAIGGTVGAIAAALVLGLLVLNRLGWTVSVGQLLGLGVLVSVVGQAGDVAESLFKREAGVKDSSTLIPGHGGVLDRLDSLYFVIPAAAGLFKLYRLI
ncbi:MAG TPA: phosphatidate cytidylyltransferase [Gemmatimonadales bacterium]|nr:phosphatidate cytidylyltransferase [Gemmatimonadales bacterium]